MESKSASQDEIYNKLKGGPHGLGDPDDKSLRKIEKTVLVPKKMREKARTEMCKDEVKSFSDCGARTGLKIVYKCREENRIMFNCMQKWFTDPEFEEVCTQEYLAERSDYRRTGIKLKQRKLEKRQLEQQKLEQQREVPDSQM